jgi:hypothetical protein
MDVPVKKFAAIKRTRDNDNHISEEEEFVIKIFDTRIEAVKWLVGQYEYWEGCSGVDSDVDGDWNPDLPEWKVLENFLMTSSSDEAIFHWQWKRRSNFRTYRIVEYTDDLRFYQVSKTLYKLKNEIMIKKKKN